MARAMRVACSMSPEAPEVMFSLPKTISSATRPPIATANCEVNSTNFIE